MKKNYKYISAAAAALLAVAPVAGSVVSAAQVNNGTAPTSTDQGKTTFSGLENGAERPYTLSLTNSANATNGETVASYKSAVQSGFGVSFPNKVDSQSGTPTVSATVKSVVDGTNVNEKGEAKENSALKDSDTFEVGHTYVAYATVTVSGLTSGAKYKFNGTEYSADQNGRVTINGDVTATSYVADPTVSKPYFTVAGDNTILADGTFANVNKPLSTKANETVADVLKAAKEAVTAYENNSGAAGDPTHYTTTETNVADELAGEGVTLSADKKNVTKWPASATSVTLTYTNKDGKTATVKVVFAGTASSSTTDKTLPVFDKNSNENAQGVITLTVNKNTTAKELETAVDGLKLTAKQREGSSVAAKVSYNYGSVDTSKAGVYTLTATATNVDGKTATKNITVIVADNGSVKAYQDGNEYAIIGNTVAATGDTVKADDVLYTGDTKTINGVSYTQVSKTSADDAKKGNTWVETSVLSPVTVTYKTIMHVAGIYNANGTKGSAKINAYSNIPTYGTKTINNKKFYAVNAAQTQFVLASNIDGSSRTLTHNAYVYNSKGNRVKSLGTLKKGTTTTTYGSQFTIKGKKYYRINMGRYVKAANFR